MHLLWPLLLLLACAIRIPCAGESLLIDWQKGEKVLGSIKGPGAQWLKGRAAGGMACRTGADAGSCYYGARMEPFELPHGARIVVTWLNAGREKIDFRPRISFTDTDAPLDKPGEPFWYPMGPVARLGPGERTRTYHDPVRAGAPESRYLPPSTGRHASVNILPALKADESLSSLLCLFVELTTADIEAPPAPRNLAGKPLSDSRVRLEWLPGGEPRDVERYRVHVDGRLAFLTSDPVFEVPLLEPGRAYRFHVTAEDSAGNVGDASQEVTVHTLEFQAGDSAVNPWSDLSYEGAFRLPESSGPASRWSYLVAAMTHRPPASGQDSLPGTLFLSGHAHNLGHVAEITIPEPRKWKSRDARSLPRARTVQPFANLRPATLENIGQPRYALAWLPENPAKGGQGGYLVSTFLDYYYWSKKPMVSVARAHLAQARPRGTWFIGSKEGGPPYYAAGQYLFSVPSRFRADCLDGMPLVTGAYRYGDTPSGPSLVAFRPPLDEQKAHESELSHRTLLLYERHGGAHTLEGFHRDDLWHGGAWLQAGEKTAVVLAGSKAYGRFWYGFPDGVAFEDVVHSLPRPQFSDPKGGQASLREPMLLFYRSSDLCKVAQGRMPAERPQPYAAMRIGEFLISNDIETEHSGYDALSFDPRHGRLYALESRAYGDSRPVIHVWHMEKTAMVE